MNETTNAPLPPPAVPAGPHSGGAPRAVTNSGLTHPVAVFLAAAAAGLALAITIGGSIGFGIAAMSATDCSPNDGWCELGAALIGAFAGIVTGVLAYVISGIAVIRRVRPAGHRAANVVAHLLAPPVVAIVLGFTSELASNIG